MCSTSHGGTRWRLDGPSLLQVHVMWGHMFTTEERTCALQCRSLVLEVAVQPPWERPLSYLFFFFKKNIINADVHNTRIITFTNEHTHILHTLMSISRLGRYFLRSTEPSCAGTSLSMGTSSTTKKIISHKYEHLCRI